MEDDEMINVLDVDVLLFRFVNTYYEVREERSTI